MKIPIIYFLWASFMINSLASCQTSGNATQKKTDKLMDCSSNIQQGISGKIIWKEGNLMPGPGSSNTSNRSVQRTMLVYELTNLSQANKDGYFFKDISSKLVTQSTSDKKGCFAINLSPGVYSLFSQEEDGIYANEFDGQGNIFKVEVKKGQVTEVQFIINYKAQY